MLSSCDRTRIISFVKNQQHQPALNFDSSCISALYLGINISEADKNRLIKIINSTYPKAMCYIAKKHSKHIELNFNEV